MLDNISTKFNKVFRYLKGEAKITEDNMKTALREIKLSLLEADVNFRVVKTFVNNVKEQALGSEVQESLSPYQQIVKIVRAELESMLGTEAKDLVCPAKPTVIMLTGLQGTGKTTTAGKLALYLKEKGKSSILSSIDLKRLAATEQLETIAKETGVNYYKSDSNDPEKIVKGLIKEAKEYGYDYVIVDTAGRLHIDQELMDELVRVKKVLKPHEVLYVADSLTGQDAVNSAKEFSESVGIDSVILTKLDADSRGGAALSIVSVTGKPIKFAGVGEKYSDFEKFHPDRLASKILGMGDVLTLIEKAEKEFDDKQAEVMAKKMLHNEFTLDDFAAQMKQMKKLGSMSDIMGMLPGGAIPGMGNLNGANIDDRKVSHIVAIISSMTPYERRKPKIINGRRRIRISKGCGRPVSEINQLLKNFREVQKYMKKPFFRKMLKKFDFLSKMG